MTPLCKAAGCTAVLALASAVWTAQAAGQDEEDTARARALFESGVGLSDGGDWSGAADHFRRSLEIRWSPVVSFNLATALVHTGRLVEAEELFRRALRDEGAPARLRAAAEAQLAELEPRIAQLTLEITGPREGVDLTLDGDVLPDALIGVAMPEDPGLHELVARREGEPVARAQIELADGQHAVLALSIPAVVLSARETALRAPPAEVPAAVPSFRSHGGDDTLFIALAIAGGILVVGAAVVITAVVLTQGHGDPVEGNLGPSVIVFE